MKLLVKSRYMQPMQKYTHFIEYLRLDVFGPVLFHSWGFEIYFLDNGNGGKGQLLYSYLEMKLPDITRRGTMEQIGYSTLLLIHKLSQKDNYISKQHYYKCLQEHRNNIISKIKVK